ncbi:caspase-8-like [Haliotis rufescens]|uniref:caspase-8-like n=1 Tax=Haliotis rufescens TaxID=6454 RepID=UPI00201EF097|nr:caspase-8-like [Haliotis rufescens]
MADGFNITMVAGSGKGDKFTMAGVVAGGVNNEYESPPKSEGLQTDLPKATINMTGPGQDAQYKDMKMLGFVQDGMDNKVRSQETPGSNQGHVPRFTMDSIPRGWCYIFNNKTFDGEPTKTRIGTNKDRDDLTRVWKELKFEVKSFDDPKAGVMETKIQELSKMDHKARDCVVVIFLTHGRDGAVQGSDNEWLEVSTITSYFKASVCPSLANKPKLFFFQSCRGIEIQKAVPAQGDDGGSAPAGTEKKNPADKMVAPEADFFFGFAAVAGTQALRHPETGSWFIQALVQSLQDSAKSDDLESIMTVVRGKVNDHQVETLKGEFQRQTAEVRTTLSKKVYF